MKKLTISLMLAQILTVAGSAVALGDSRVGPMAGDEFQPGAVVCPYIAKQMYKHTAEAVAQPTQTPGKSTSKAL